MKKIISILLVVVMSFCLASCSFNESIQILENSIAKYYMSFEIAETQLVALEEFLKANKGQIIFTTDDISETPIVIDDALVEEMLDYFEEIRDLKNIGTKEAPVYGYYVVDAYSIKDYANNDDTSGHWELTPTEIAMYMYEETVYEAMMYLFDISGGADQELEKLLNYLDLEYSCSTTIKMPYKITKTNATLVDDYTVDISDVLGDNFLYVVTEESTSEWALEDNIKQVFVDNAKQHITSMKTKKPVVCFDSETSAYIDFIGNYFPHYAVEYKTSGGKWKTPKNMKPDSYYGVVIKDLKPGKKYDFRIKGYYESDDFGKVYGVASKSVSLDFGNLKTPKFTLTSGKKSFKINMKKDYKGIWYYQVKYSKNKNMKNAKTKKFTSKIKTIEKLKPNTTYYVKIRKAFKYNTFSDWTKVKTIKTK